MSAEPTPGSDDPLFHASSLWSGFPPYPHPSSPLDSNSHLSAHEELLKDPVALHTYKRAILRSPHLFKGKTVLDIHCGLGVLSHFAIKAGAKHVFATDKSPAMVDFAEQIAISNSVSDRITFLRGEIDTISLPVESVDVIVSLWMGYFLFHEGRLATLIYARDKWLKPGGLMFPNKARMMLAAAEDAKYKYEKVEFWSSVYGADMSFMRNLSILEPSIDSISPGSLVSSACPAFDLDLETISLSSHVLVGEYSLEIHRRDFAHALVAWFEVGFTHSQRPVTLTTSPRLAETMWRQTIFYLENAQPVSPGEVLWGSIAVQPTPKRPTGLDIKVSFHLAGEHPLESCQFFRMR